MKKLFVGVSTTHCPPNWLRSLLALLFQPPIPPPCSLCSAINTDFKPLGGQMPKKPTVT